MAHQVGTKGQVVIDQKIRKALGITPGSQTVQRIVDDHVEIRFLPAEHDRSLKGAARAFITKWPADPDDTEQALASEIARHYRETLP